MEEYTITKLQDFIDEARDKGICYNGADIEKPLQKLIIDIIEDYIIDYMEF